MLFEWTNVSSACTIHNKNNNNNKKAHIKQQLLLLFNSYKIANYAFFCTSINSIAVRALQLFCKMTNSIRAHFSPAAVDSAIYFFLFQPSHTKWFICIFQEIDEVRILIQAYVWEMVQILWNHLNFCLALTRLNCDLKKNVRQIQLTVTSTVIDEINHRLLAPMPMLKWNGS